jgi:hypothetical protein
MAEFVVSLDEDMQGVVEAIARLKGVTVQEVLRDLLSESLETLRTRLNDPMIGAFASGRSDISERDEELLYGGWQPD